MASTVWRRYFIAAPDIVAREWAPEGGWRGPRGPGLVAHLVPRATPEERRIILQLFIFNEKEE
jgi:hypothetical protein